MRIHADDFGICEQQAKAILNLSSSCNGKGTLNSISIFTNSPYFIDSCKLIQPFVQRNEISLSLHINLVEGPSSCADANTIPILVDKRGMFKNNFATLLLLSLSPYRKQLYRAIVKECSAQINRYLKVFPEQRTKLSLDTHQHVHAIPLVLDALLASVSACQANLVRMRIPTENLSVYKNAGILSEVSWQNRLKIRVINFLCKKAPEKIPSTCSIPLFCGVGLSGKMYKINQLLIDELNHKATQEGKDLELLFHPVSVPIHQCLDPHNKPFARACASIDRDKEAQKLLEIRIT
ncbi:putative uncharacterized protein [Cryptobacterium sp. CAG:338]|nr:putative uncharacterized protein [Cryptobacterium sp. CAG:338]